VIGPSHFVPLACCAIPDAASAECPLGDIPFDMPVIERLTSVHSSLFRRLDAKTAEVEHSCEMMLSLVKSVFAGKPFTVVPIMVGEIGLEQCAEVAAALRDVVDVVDDRTLVVVSSDFCHWGERFEYQFLPDGEGAIHERIKSMDLEGAAMITTGDPAQFWEYTERTQNTICGKRPIIIMMSLFDNWTVTWPHYSQSSQVTSRDDSSVSYLAGVVRTPE